jgi:hypothetical protein
MKTTFRVASAAAVAVVLSAVTPFAFGATRAAHAAAAPGGPTARELDGVSCASASDCTAVGSSGSSAVEHWNGTSWSVQATTDPPGSTQAHLKAVSCPASGTCMAVGSFAAAGGHTTAFAQRLAGGHWTVSSVSTASAWPFSELDGVSCTSATNCMAVGADETQGGGLAPLVEHFDGRNWTIEGVPVSGVGSLAAVSCTSASFCAAVGDVLTSSPGAFEPSFGTLALGWNGSRWGSQTAPGHGQLSGGLLGVSCTSASACEAVGENAGGQPPNRGTAVAERWNGSSWASAAVPAPAGAVETQLAGLSCASASDCTASGFTFTPGGSPFATVLEHWNGTSWMIVTAPAPMAGAELTGISCRPGGGCLAVGVLADSTSSVAESIPRTGPGSCRCAVTPSLRHRRT